MWTEIVKCDYNIERGKVGCISLQACIAFSTCHGLALSCLGSPGFVVKRREEPRSPASFEPRAGRVG